MFTSNEEIEVRECPACHECVVHRDDWCFEGEVCVNCCPCGTYEDNAIEMEETEGTEETER